MDQAFIQLFGSRVARSQIVSVHEEKQVWPMLFRAIIILTGLFLSVLVTGLALDVEPIASAFWQFLGSEFPHLPARPAPDDVSTFERVLFLVVPLLGFLWVPLVLLAKEANVFLRLRPVIVLTNARIKGPFLRPVVSNALLSAISSELEKPNENFDGFALVNTRNFEFGGGLTARGDRANLTPSRFYPQGRPVLSELAPSVPLDGLMAVVLTLARFVVALVGAAFLVWFSFLAYAGILYQLEFEYIFSNSDQIKDAFLLFFKVFFAVIIPAAIAVPLLQFVTGWVFRDGALQIHVFHFNGNRVFKTLVTDGGAFELKWKQAGLKEKIQEELGVDIALHGRFGWDSWLVWTAAARSKAVKVGFSKQESAEEPMVENN